MDEIDKLIDSIYINGPNIEHIATTHVINGRLRTEIRRVMIEYGMQQSIDTIERLKESIKINI